MKILKFKVFSEPDLITVERTCSDADYYKNLSSAQLASYNGEVTVEDIPLTAEEARTERNKLLEESDWTQVLDAPIDTATREAYRLYRQVLRDIPEQEGFPETITWPELPTITKADPDPTDTSHSKEAHAG